MTAPVYITEWQADIRLFVQDENGTETERGGSESWATYAGAGLTAAGSKTRPGGMGKSVALGGPATRANGTVTTQLTPDIVASQGWMESRIGRARGRIQVTYLDDEGVVIPGAVFNVTGRLEEATLPGQNYESANVGMYTVALSLDELSYGPPAAKN